MTKSKTAPDCIVSLGRSVAQHGLYNDRVYLMRLHPEDDPAVIIRQLDALAEEHGYGKLFAKAPERARQAFTDAGYEVEAEAPGFFGGEETGLFLGKFRDPARREDPDAKLVTEVREMAREIEAKGGEPAPAVPYGHALRALGPDDTPAIAAVYREVFETYPFPIHDPAYIVKTMQEGFRYFGIEGANGTLRAVSSAEVDPLALNAEMTDFATLPPFRGKSLSRCLLAAMERDCAKDGVRTGFTIARSVSAGMNLTFAKLGYHFAGTLVQNTNIGGGIESMNVWSKPLPQGEH